ncbi:MAG: DUF2214 domain-containing protein, partial [Pseudomonadota bacterium]
MGETLAWIAATAEGSSLAGALKFSRWGYSLTNLAHIFGVALLIGAILPLDLRLLGLWRGIDRAALARVLVPVAAIGLAIALAAGGALFTVRAGDYVKATLLAWKLAFIAVGTVAAILIHVRAGLWIERATARQAAAHGATS